MAAGAIAYLNGGNGEELTFLTFINTMRIQQASANLQQVIKNSSIGVEK